MIEPARSDRSTCQTCRQPIAEGELRLSEAFVSDEGRWASQHRNARTPKARSYDSYGGDWDSRYRNHDAQNPDVWARFHHLACAAKSQPYKLKYALAWSGSGYRIPNLDELEATIERALSAVDVAEDNADTRDEYHAFVARLRESADDDLMLVFGDWLQRVGDPRGELVALQHALETATGEDKVRLADTERKLLAQHRKQLEPERLDGTPTWRRGFVHRLALKNVDTASLARALAHPSFRLVRELAVEIPGYSSLVIAPNLPAPLPDTLRVLELGDPLYDQSIGPLGPLLANALPQLQRLALRGAAELEDVAHPTLSVLELASVDARRVSTSTRGLPQRTLVARLAGLSRKRLPKLERLVLRVARGLDAALAALAETPVLAKLPVLELHGDLTPAGLDAVVAHRRKVGTLDLRGVPRGLATLDSVKRIATTVVVPEDAALPAKPAAKPVGEWLVRHTRKPEWGTGKVVAELDEGLEVEFEHAGKKQVRNVELLEEI